MGTKHYVERILESFYLIPILFYKKLPVYYISSLGFICFILFLNSYNGFDIVLRVLLSEMYDLSFQNFTTLPLVQYSTLALNCRLDRIDLSYHILLYCHNIDTNTIGSSEQVSKQCLNISSGHMDLQFTYVPSFLELGFIHVCLSCL